MLPRLASLGHEEMNYEHQQPTIDLIERKRKEQHDTLLKHKKKLKRRKLCRLLEKEMETLDSPAALPR